MLSIRDDLLQWQKNGIIKTGQFTLKSGKSSPIYIDLRQLIAYPKLLQSISEKLWNSVSTLCFPLICGVPYTALPIASYLSIEKDVPMVLRRKEPKKYGTAKRVEGVFSSGQNCLIIEDTTTTGSSIIETAYILREEGLLVTDAVVVVDREEGASEALTKEGITLHRVTTLAQILSVCDQVSV